MYSRNTQKDSARPQRARGLGIETKEEPTIPFLPQPLFPLQVLTKKHPLLSVPARFFLLNINQGPDQGEASWVPRAHSFGKHFVSRS